MKRKVQNLLVCSCLVAGSLSAGELNVYFGNLHSHTSYSDGSGTPREAYKYAQKEGELDFLAISEHNHKSAMHPKEPKNATGIYSNHNLYYSSGYDSMSTAAKVCTKTGKFVAIIGQEYSTIAPGNHVNVFEIKEVIDENDVPNAEYATLVSWLSSRTDTMRRIPMIQLNHPDEDAEEADTDYGAKEFGNTVGWVKAMGRHACLIEVLCGPALKKGEGLQPRRLESYYNKYLGIGFRVAPTGGQDNHYRTWGTITDARTGIIAEKLTKQDLLEAMRMRHVYATTDKNLRAIFKVDGHLCGDTNICQGAPVPSTLPVTFSVKDDDEPYAEYVLEVYAGKVGQEKPDKVGKHSFKENTPDGKIPGGITLTNGYDYLYFKLIQKQEHEQADVVWTAPVWFN